jgi:hypothetical protein
MGPEQWKGEVSKDGERREPDAEQRRERKGAAQEELDPREEDGWTQPESSAQKLPEGGVPDES